MSKYKNIRATIIVRVNGLILLVVARNGLTLLPGGRVPRGALPISAAARELYEETGLVATSLSYLFEYESFSNLHHVFFVEACGEAVAADDAVRLEYLSGSVNAVHVNMSPATRAIIAKFYSFHC